MRLIDADALKRKVQKIATESWKMKMTASVETVLNQFIDYIEQSPTVGGWISVNDRLPDKSGTYLCYQPKVASICALNTYRWSTVSGWMGHEVGSRIEGIESWMPLPKPPEVDK